METSECAEKVNALWLALATQIQDAIPDIIISNDDPVKAIQWATCAEACFWKATGEADTHDIKDVLPPRPVAGGSD